MTYTEPDVNKILKMKCEACKKTLTREWSKKYNMLVSRCMNPDCSQKWIISVLGDLVVDG